MAQPPSGPVEKDGLVELADLAPELLELAEDLGAIHREFDDVLSSIYLMY